MIESESQIKRMTKNELKQWLTKHDQRLPTIDKKKPFYVNKAISYFKLLQQERDGFETNQKIKRQKKKNNINKVKTKRRHSSINESPKPSLTKSKRKIIKIKRKTATKQSPSLKKSLKKKRDRVRRATADHISLTNDITSITDSDIDSESENDGDCNNKQFIERSNNIKKRQFICSRDIDPEKMTIKDLQQWLDENKINFQRGQKKATYVKLVRKHSLPTSFNANSNYIIEKKYVSPVRKNINNAPLPYNLRQSPLTPPKDDQKQNIQKEGKKSGVLLTPALNKTGIRPIQTPEKAAMRDEIRCLLNLDDDENDLNPIYALKDSICDDNKTNNNDITPGGPSNYDPEVLNNVLSDVRREQEKQKYIQPQQKERSPLKSAANDISYYNQTDLDNKENDCINVGNVASNSFFNSIMNRFSPYKQVSQSVMKDAANSVFKVHDTSIIRKGKRTIPSPASTDDSTTDSTHDSPKHHYYSDNYHGNNRHSGSVSMSPPSPIYHDNDDDDNDDDIPQTPAIPNYNIINPRKSPPQKKQKIKSPSKPIIIQKQEMNIKRRHPTIRYNAYIHPKNVNQSNQIIASKPSSFNDNEAIKKQKPKSNKMRNIFGKFTLFAFIVTTISYFFILFDGMIYINNMIDGIIEIINNFNVEEKTLFCDKNKEIISGLSLPLNFKCHKCPQYASICKMGKVKCMTNYILQDDKCIVDGVIVKLAFDIRDQVIKILSLKKGKTECGESLDKDYSLTQHELMSNTEIIDERKKFEAFDYFKKNILPESQLISINKQDRYYSHISIKSPKCRIKEWAINNILGLIATFIIIILVFGIWRKQKLAQKEKKNIQLMTNEIYKLLQEYDQFDHGQHVPVQQIKQRIKPKSNKIWNEAEKIIQTDIRIQKSMRMIDGLQRKCWRVSISSNNNNTNNNNNTGFRFPPHSKHSMW